ncbi:hypothetical protein ACSGFO_13285 [Mesorhizobium sp. WSM4083]|uniref:hypothetical protein n=1 Tax=Mesorhizobium sp. WSM4083 TaxID=3446363 RepID=UPI0012DE192A
MTAAEIAEKKMPGWKAVAPAGLAKPFGAKRGRAMADEGPAGMAAAKVDAVMPTTRQLRSKFLGEDNAADETATAEPLERDVELVDLKSGDLERTVAVNRKTQEIDWSQG